VVATSRRQTFRLALAVTACLSPLVGIPLLGAIAVLMIERDDPTLRRVASRALRLQLVSLALTALSIALLVAFVTPTTTPWIESVLVSIPVVVGLVLLLLSCLLLFNYVKDPTG
jgi:hypothetical protein